jgi:hypothetical protein
MRSQAPHARLYDVVSGRDKEHYGLAAWLLLSLVQPSAYQKINGCLHLSSHYFTVLHGVILRKV